jgi:integrase/recombinase XerD
VPPEVEWLANLSNPSTRRACENAILDFIGSPVSPGRRNSAPWPAHTYSPGATSSRTAGLAEARSGTGSPRSRLLFAYSLWEQGRPPNPVKSVERPRTESGEGKTPALGDRQARELLATPRADTLKSKRDRPNLSTSLFHALRREKLCTLKVRDFGTRGKGCRIWKSPARAARPDICHCTQAPMRWSTTT